MNINQAKAAAACERVAATIQRSLEMERRNQINDRDVLRVPLVAYALATLRQRIAPALTSCWSKDPTHIAMFGGTNSGKSTVLNLLLGQPSAGMEPLARYTQHPSAFSPDSLGDGFLINYPTRFQGYKRYNGQQPPRQSDSTLRKGYQLALSVHQLEPDAALTHPVSTRAIFWDAPDYSTEEASFYMDALLAAIASADLVVMVVTPENYAGHRDMLLRGLIIHSGVPVRVVANKLQDGSRLLDDIKRKVCEKIKDDDPMDPVAPERVHSLPLISGRDAMVERLQLLVATDEAADLRRHIANDVASDRLLKKQALAGTIHFLARRFTDLLAPLQSEVEIASQWVDAVNRATQNHFYQPYKRDYLDGQHYADFNLAFLEFLNLLELPGIGNLIATAAKSLRGVSSFVLRKIRSFFNSEPPKKMPEEQAILQAGAQRWIEELKAFAQQQAEQTSHPEWRRLAEKMDQASFLDQIGGNMYEAWLQHRKTMDDLIQVQAQALRQYVEERPNLRKTLQGAKFAADAAAVVGAVATGGLDPTDLLIGPAVVALMRIVMEIVGEQFVEGQKKVLKQKQYDAMRQVIDRHMAESTRQLFQATISLQELEQVCADFALVKEAALEVASGLTN